MRRSQIINRLRSVSDAVQDEIRKSIDPTNRFSAGLSTEGYNGGYQAAIEDVIAYLHEWPNDRNGWWSKELKTK